MNTWIVSMKVFLISAGAVAVAVGLRLSVPMAVNEVPAIWSAVLLWTKPPYLYIIINGIIITIAASSRFHHRVQSEPSVPARSEDNNLISVKTPPPLEFASMTAPPEIRTIIEESTAVFENQAVEFMKPVVVNGAPVDIETVGGEEEVVEADDSEEADRAEAEDEFVESTFTYNDNNHNNMPPQEIISPEPHDHLENIILPVRENKPLVLSRFGNRKPIRTTPHEGVGGVRALRRVARPKKHETLESTWRMITEGRHVPLTRHLKKSSDTFEHHQHVDHVPKSETTFKDRTNNELPPVQRFRKEPSVGQDELNRRVEAFIKKFNEDMRMQRQESLNRYMEMINRGV